MPADFEVKVNLVEATPGHPGHVVPVLPEFMNVHKTVHYFNPQGGAVKIEFIVDGSPFVDNNGNEIRTITDNDVLTLMKKGSFTCHCFVTPQNAAVAIGWDDKISPLSGGIHVVK